MAGAFSVNGEKVQWVERTTPEQMIEKMMAERRKLDRETKLTWNPNKPPMAPLDRVVGDVNLSLPYMKITGERPGQYFFIQNARFFRSNGRECTIEEISREVSDVTLHYIIQAHKTFIKDAIGRDPSLCSHCFMFRAESYDDYTQHLINKHPDVLQGQIDKTEPVAVEEVVVAPVQKPMTQAYDFVCCGKGFKNKAAINAHKRFGHKKVTQPVDNAG